jgi:hypothetical protein
VLKSTRDLALLLVIAVGIGFLLSRVAPARPAPSPTPTPVAETPTPVPTAPTDDVRVWSQPIVGGCAEDAADVYLVSYGGGIARFDGKTWYLVDDTLRSMRAVACMPGLAIAVGDGSRLVRIDTSAHTVTPELPLGDEDLFAIDSIDPGSIVVAGSALAIRHFVGDHWEHIGGGGEDQAWRAVLLRSNKEIWFAGDDGLLFVFDGKKFVDRSIAKGPKLTALSWLGDDVLVGAEDGTLYTVSASKDARVAGHRTGAVRALKSFGGGVYVLADDLTLFGAPTPPGTVITVPITPEQLQANGLACPITSMFTGERGELWLVARQGARAGVARFDGAWTKWGRC